MRDDTRKMVVPMVIMCVGFLCNLVALLFVEPKTAALVGAPLIFGGGALYFINMAMAFRRMCRGRRPSPPR